MNEKAILRARDFWASIVLFLISVFFLYKTTDIPFFDTRSAGVDSAEWFNSAALVPFGIFGTLLILSLVLFLISIVEGGAQHALTAVGLGCEPQELTRLGCISLILFFYIFALVPRVDFIISSALLITSLIWGFHKGAWRPMVAATSALCLAGLYAFVMNFPASQWGANRDDDWIALTALVVLTIYMFIYSAQSKQLDRVVKTTPVIAIMCPLILVLAMAFGFKQNVPNRSGLLFKQIEYHYYVTLKPIFSGK